MAFYQKYRSQTFSEMVGQDHIVLTLKEAVKSNRLVHAYLLTGPRGIGKTSTARLLAKAINCEKLSRDRAEGKEISGEPCNKCASCLEINAGSSIDVVEIDAASHTGVDDIRDLIEKARLLPTRSAKKVYIIDEVHMLSKSAFNALLKTLEEPAAHVVFIMATTEVHKIPATILSRAQRFDFKRASKAEILANLKRVAKEEKIESDVEALELIAVAAAGGHRDALSLLEKLSSGEGKITRESARQILGIAESEDTFQFLGAIFNNYSEEGLKIAHRLFEAGYDLAEFNRGIIEKIRVILLLKMGSNDFDETDEHLDSMRELGQKVSLDRLIQILEVFIEAGVMLKDVAYPLLPIEIAVVKAIDSADKKEILPTIKSEITVSASDMPILKSETKKESPKMETKKQEPPINMEPNKDGNDVPVPVLEMTRDIWQQIMIETKKSNASLAAILGDAKPVSLTDDTLTLEVKFKFHKDRISDSKNSQLLEKIVFDITGCRYRVISKIGDAKDKAPVKPAGSIEEVEKAVTEVFETDNR